MRPSSSDRARGALLFGVLLALIVGALGVTVGGCVMVRPEEREYLADPAMTFGSEGIAGEHEEHVLSNREGSAGAGAVTGGGCGCN
ncbi:MAG: DUF4266 domain-containing protein [Myxococcales bacterium]|nr:DUF4266 domain-containing protein [Myxococcales bacterium]